MRLRAIACGTGPTPHLAAVYPPRGGLRPRGQGATTSGHVCNALQQRIDAADESRYDAIVLGYALCSNSTAGLAARGGLVRPRPRLHHLYLGSRAAYAASLTTTPAPTTTADY